MRTRIILATLLGLGLFTPAAMAQAPTPDPAQKPAPINARQHRQAARIRDGVKEGELTKGELDKLRADEAAVRAEERVYRKSGGPLAPAERRDLQRDLNKTSREIHRAKHNGRAPKK
jgi:hypothetical protein